MYIVTEDEGKTVGIREGWNGDVFQVRQEFVSSIRAQDKEQVRTQINVQAAG